MVPRIVIVIRFQDLHELQERKLSRRQAL